MKTTFLILFIFISLVSISQESVNASGGNATGSGGSFSYTIGQIDYIEASGVGGSVNQGIQQAYEIFEEVNNNIFDLYHNINIYPNPATDMITLDMLGGQGYSYTFFDAKGTLLNSAVINSPIEYIPITDRASGVYILNILKDNKTYKYRVIKR